MKKLVLFTLIFLFIFLKQANALPDLYIDIWWSPDLFPQSLCAYLYPGGSQWECIKPTYIYEPTYMVNIISNDTFCLNRSCQILMTICNLGNSSLEFCIPGIPGKGFFTLTIYDEKNNTVFSDYNNFICFGREVLPPGYCLPPVPYSYTENWIPQLPPGIYYVYVTADPSNFWNETNENNNLLIIKWTILGHPTPPTPPPKICDVSTIPTSIENYPIKFLCLFINLFYNPIFTLLFFSLIFFLIIITKIKRAIR